MHVKNLSSPDYNDPMVQKIAKLKTDSQLSVLTGDYKQARKAYRELAEIGVDKFELVASVPNTVHGNIPIFSKYGRRCLMYMFLGLFHKKTPAEKKFQEMGKLYAKGLLSIKP